MKHTLFAVFVFAFAQAASSQDLAELKKNNFTGALYGLNWGDEVSVEILSKQGCPKYPASPEILPKWSTQDWCEHIQRTALPSATDNCKDCPRKVTCARKLWPQSKVEFCYVGANFMFEDRNREHPSPGVARHLLNLDSFALNKAPSMDDEVHVGGEKQANGIGFRLFPVAFEGQASTRYLVSWFGSLVGFASSSEVPEKYEPKFFLIQSEKKYGAPTTKKAFPSPLQDRYSDCWTWNRPADRFAQVTCITPKDLSNTGKARIDNMFFEKNTLIKLVKQTLAEIEAEERSTKKDLKSKEKEGAQDVDY